MSRHKKLRENKRCENCGHFVEKRFCPQCGQENVETRHPFHYLFTHFVEDFVHYDSQFWKTIGYLLFRPAKLTREYLSGRRLTFVSPVRLYIFISFVTFFIPAVLSDSSSQSSEKEKTKQEVTTDTKTNNDNLKNTKELNLKIGRSELNYRGDKVQENIKHHFPQAVFCYMPVFAFWLWLVHNKKKWYYFDHGIYTLHYFSFILLSFLFYVLLGKLLKFLPLNTHFIQGTITFALFCYYIYYFFHSHRLVYRETKAVSRLKCILLFCINTLSVFVFFLLYAVIITYITDQNIIKDIVNEINK